MRNRGMRERNKGIVVWLAMFFCIALISALPITSYAESQYYESEYCKVYYDDAGDDTDDKLAYWLAYDDPNQPFGTADCSSIDWAFLYAVWGLGWDRIFLASGGVQDIINSVGKLPVYLVDEGESGTYGYTYFEWGGYTSWGIYLNYAYYPNILDPQNPDLLDGTIDPDGDGRPNEGFYESFYTHWWDPLFNICSVAAHETSHAIYGKYVGYNWFNGSESNLYYYHGFMTETLAWYVGSVMWPVSEFHEDLGTIQAQYRENMEAGDYLYTSFGQAEWNYRNATTYEQFYRGTMTFLGAGYLLSNWDDLFGNTSSPDYVAAWSAGLAGSVYRVFNLLTYLRYDTGNDDFSGAFAYAYDGHQAKMSGLTYWNLDPDSNDLNAWLFYLMWDYWYQA